MIWQGSNVGENQIVSGFFSHKISWNKMWIWSTNGQTQRTWKSWLTNLRNIKATDTFYACFHRRTAFTFAPGFVTDSTIHIICGCITAAGKLTHVVPPISNWNFWFCRFKRVWLQAKFFEVSVPDEDSNSLEDILANKMIKKMNLMILLLVPC